MNYWDENLNKLSLDALVGIATLFELAEQNSDEKLAELVYTIEKSAGASELEQLGRLARLRGFLYRTFGPKTRAEKYLNKEFAAATQRSLKGKKWQGRLPNLRRILYTYGPLGGLGTVATGGIGGGAYAYAKKGRKKKRR